MRLKMPKTEYQRRRRAAIKAAKAAAMENKNKPLVPMMVKNENGYELLNPKIVDYLDNHFEGNRWTKGSFDRLYPVAEDLGFEIDTYKTGNISHALVKEYPKINGVDMSLVNYYTGDIAHSRASKLTGYIRDTWINLKTGAVETKLLGGSDEAKFILERVKYKVLEAQLNAE